MVENKKQRLLKSAAFDTARRKLKADTSTRDNRARGGAGVSILWLLKKIAGENALVAKRERALSMRGKTNPRVRALVEYWLVLSSMVGAGVAGTVHAPDVVDAAQEWVDAHADMDAKRGTFAAYKDMISPITPLLVAELVANEGIVMRDGMHVVYDDATGKPLAPGQKPKGKATIGFGSTVLPDGTAVTSYTPPITTEQAYEIARWHLERKETYFFLYCYDTGCETVNVNSTGEAFSLSSVIYNSGTKLIENPADRNHRERNATLRNLYEEYGDAVPDSLVRAAFMTYPITDLRSFGAAYVGDGDKVAASNSLGNFVREGRGLYVRRMIECGMMTGEIEPDIMLDLPSGGLYEFLRYMGGKKSDFWVNGPNGIQIKPGVIDAFKEWVKNPVNRHGEKLVGQNWPRIRDVLPADVVAVCDAGICKLGARGKHVDINKWDAVKTQTYVINNHDTYDDAIAMYRSGDYAGAASALERMLKQNPDNALLHNDLAVAYNRLGQYQMAIAHSREILHRIGDKTQYAAAQYNAGYAYEQMGDLQKALANYKLSVANGNRRVAADVERVTKLIRNKNNRAARFSDAKSHVGKRVYAPENAAYSILNTNQNA